MNYLVSQSLSLLRENHRVADQSLGMTFTKDQQERPVVQITYNLNSTNAETLAWSLPFDDTHTMPSPPWQESIKEAGELFSQENELDGHVMSRTYGLDASPLGELCAANSSNHPTDGVEYIIASDQISSLIVAPARELADHEILPVAGGPSHPSGILFCPEKDLLCGLRLTASRN